MPGAFTKAFYTSDAALVHTIRVQPESLTLTMSGTSNTGPVGPASANAPRVRVSGGKRKLGIVARKAYIQFTGTPPTGYKAGSTIAIPILSPTFYATMKAAAIAGTAGTYTAVGSTASPIICIGVTAEGGRG